MHLLNKPAELLDIDPVVGDFGWKADIAAGVTQRAFRRPEKSIASDRSLDCSFPSQSGVAITNGTFVPARCLTAVAQRILIVEDDHLNRMLLCAILQGSGFHIMEVTDGAHALEAAQSFVPNLITMDINLPNVSGLELIKIMKADVELRTIPILAVTAYMGRGEDAAIRAAGANDLMTKPIHVKPFLSTVKRLISN